MQNKFTKFWGGVVGHLSKQTSAAVVMFYSIFGQYNRFSEPITTWQESSWTFCWHTTSYIYVNLAYWSGYACFVTLLDRAAAAVAFFGVLFNGKYNIPWPDNLSGKMLSIKKWT